MSLHNRIMNIPANNSHSQSYKAGHRDARHAAAEMSLEYEEEIERLRARLAELEGQEPVAWMTEITEFDPPTRCTHESQSSAENYQDGAGKHRCLIVPLYRHPAPVGQELCEDEGCPHHGTPHVCLTPNPVLPAVPEGWKLVPVEPTHRMLSGMACSMAKDGDGDLPPLMDIIGFSGENKTRTVLRSAYKDALAAAPQREGGAE